MVTTKKIGITYSRSNAIKQEKDKQLALFFTVALFNSTYGPQ